MKTAPEKTPAAPGIVVRNGPLDDEGIALFADLLLELFEADQAAAAGEAELPDVVSIAEAAR